VNAVLGTPRQERVIDLVQRQVLLDVVAELVDRDVVALVVHAALLDARAQVRHVVAPRASIAWPAPRDGSTAMCAAIVLACDRARSRAW
jgi:hypothetical protein